MFLSSFSGPSGKVRFCSSTKARLFGGKGSQLRTVPAQASHVQNRSQNLQGISSFFQFLKKTFIIFPRLAEARRVATASRHCAADEVHLEHCFCSKIVHLSHFNNMY